MNWSKTWILMATCLVATFVSTGCPSDPSFRLEGWLYDLHSSAIGDGIVQQSDGSYFVTGTARVDGEIRQYHGLFLTSTGDVQSFFVLPGLFSQSGSGPRTTAVGAENGTTFFAGTTVREGSLNEQQGRLRVVKTDSSGTVIWDHTYGEAPWVPRAVATSSDGGVVIALELISYDSKRPEMLLKVNDDGAAQWLTEIPQEHPSFFVHEIVVTPHGGYILVGYDNAQDPDAAAWAVDAEGEHLWFRRYDRPGSNEARSVELAPGGGLYLGGTQILANGKRRPYLLKTDADGEFEWDRDDIYLPAYAGSDVQIWDMVVDDEGYIAMVGDEITVDYIGTIPVTKGNSFLMRLDPMGNLVKKTDIGGLTYGIDFTQQGTYITTGVADKYIRVLEINKAGKVVN